MDERPELRQRLSLLAERRSVRRFTGEPVPAETIRALLEYACLAPSACNFQAWRFVIVNDDDLKRRMVAAGGGTLIAKAPCGVLVCYDNTTKNVHYRDDLQSAAACVQNLLLAAQAHGLGACWVCHLPSRRVLRRLFGIPWHYSPAAYVLLGYPASAVPKPVTRRHAVSEITGINAFPSQAGQARPSRLRTLTLRLLMRAYMAVPAWLKQGFVNRLADTRFTKKFEN
jgi:nitroreductase